MVISVTCDLSFPPWLLSSFCSYYTFFLFFSFLLPITDLSTCLLIRENHEVIRWWSLHILLQSWCAAEPRPTFCNLPLSSMQSCLCFQMQVHIRSGSKTPLGTLVPPTPLLSCQHLLGCGYFLHKYKQALSFILERKGDRNISLESTFSPFSLSDFPCLQT